MTTRFVAAKTAPNTWLARPVLSLFCVLAALLPAAREVFGADPFPLILGLDVVLGLLLLLGWVRRPPFAWVWCLGAVLLPLGAVISGVNSSIRASLILGGMLAMMCLLFPFVLTRLVSDRPNSLVRLTAWFIAGQTFSGVAAVAQLAGIGVGSGLIFGRATGFAGHPNTLGVMATLAILGAIALWGVAESRGRWVLSSTIVINAAALAGTGSLSAMLAAVVAVAFGVVASRKVIGATVSFVIIAAATLAASQILLPENSVLASIGYRLSVVTGESDGSGGAASLDVRDQTYEWAWRWINSSPFVGVGLDPLNAGTFDGTTVVHNFLLRGWYQGGLPVVLWLALVTLVVVIVMFRAIRRGRGSWPAAAALSVIVFAMTSAFLNQPTYWLPLIVAIVAAALMQARPPQPAVGGIAHTAESDEPPRR